MTGFLLTGCAIYVAFTYLAVAVSGVNIDVVWGAFDFFPFTPLILPGIGAKIVYGVGIALGVLALMLGFVTVGITNIEEVRGNRFLTMWQSVRFALARIRQVFLAEVSIIAFLGFVVGCFALIGLVTRIPVVGEWVFVLLFALPIFVIGMFAVFVFFVLVLSILLLPAVASANRTGETFDAIVETFSVLIRQPLRWGAYTAYAMVAAKVCSFVFAYFAYRAVQLIVWSATLTGGSDIRRLVESSLALVPVKSETVRQLFTLFPGINVDIDIWRYAGIPNDSAIHILMAIMLVVVFAAVFSYGLTIVAAAQARGYVVLRFLKDNHRVSDEQSLYFTPEPINDPVEESGDDENNAHPV